MLSTVLPSKQLKRVKCVEPVEDQGDESGLTQTSGSLQTL